MRKGDWLLVWHAGEGRTALYDMANDASEQHDVSADRPQVAEQLLSELRDWMGAILKDSDPLRSVPMDADGLTLMELEQEVLRELGYLK